MAKTQTRSTLIPESAVIGRVITSDLVDDAAKHLNYAAGYTTEMHCAQYLSLNRYDDVKITNGTTMSRIMVPIYVRDHVTALKFGARVTCIGSNTVSLTAYVFRDTTNSDSTTITYSVSDTGEKTGTITLTQTGWLTFILNAHLTAGTTATLHSFRLQDSPTTTVPDIPDE